MSDESDVLLLGPAPKSRGGISHNRYWSWLLINLQFFFCMYIKVNLSIFLTCKTNGTLMVQSISCFKHIVFFPKSRLNNLKLCPKSTTKSSFCIHPLSTDTWLSWEGQSCLWWAVYDRHLCFTFSILWQKEDANSKMVTSKPFWE